MSTSRTATAVAPSRVPGGAWAVLGVASRSAVRSRLSGVSGSSGWSLRPAATLWSSWPRRTGCGVGPAVSLWSRWALLSSLSAWSLSSDGVLRVASLLSQGSWLAEGAVGAWTSLLSGVAGVPVASRHSLLSLGTVVSTRAGLADGSRRSLGSGGAGVAAGVRVLRRGDIGGVLPDDTVQSRHSGLSLLPADSLRSRRSGGALVVLHRAVAAVRVRLVGGRQRRGH